MVLTSKNLGVSMRTRIMKRIGLSAGAALGAGVIALTLIAPALSVAGN